jgi:hypothetical protein
MRNKRTYYVVEGSGSFPCDMLRYDHAWPHSEAHDSHAIEQAAFSEPKGMRRIMLATDTASGPNRDRWKSFTWRVVAVGSDPYALEQWRTNSAYQYA